MATILVTGCAGFIGFNLSKALLEKNFRVIGVDNLNNAYDVRFKRKNITALNKSSNFTFFKKDIRNKAAIEGVFKKYTIDIVIHLAARTGIRKSIRYPKLYHAVNVVGTKNIYDLSFKYGVGQFIFASSSSVYGNSKKLPFSEQNKLPKATSPYAASKKQAEKLLLKLHKQYKISTTILRLFSAYGPYGRPDMAPYLFTKALLSTKYIIQFGDGTSARDYTFIDDIVTGFLSALAKKRVFAIINLGNNYPVTLSTLIKTIENETKQPVKRKILPKRKEESIITWADITSAKATLDWTPHTQFDTGMKRFVSWYKKNRQKSS